MTTDTEALRAKFERRMNLRGWSEANIRRDGLDYSSTQITEAWHAYQAGHAAAKAETAAAVAKERERVRGVCLEIADRYWTKCQNSPDDNVQRLSGISDGASYCADAIRAGAKEPSDG